MTATQGVRDVPPSINTLNLRDWAGGRHCFEAHGLAIGLRANDPRLLESASSRLPTGSRPSADLGCDRLYSLWAHDPDGANTPPSVSLYRNSQRLVRCDDPAYALERFERDVELAVAERSPTRVFIHAGVVSWRGRAVVIPGRSFSGKSTLVAALCRAGAEYYSDEYALFDADGLVHPYARGIRLRPRPDGTEIVTPRLVVGSTALPVGVVLLTRYEPGTAWRPRTMTSGQATLAMLEHTMSARRRPRRAFRVLRQALAGALCLTGPRGDADLTAGPLLQLAAGRNETPQVAWPVKSGMRLADSDGNGPHNPTPLEA